MRSELPEVTRYEVESLARQDAKDQGIGWLVTGAIFLWLVTVLVVHLRSPSLSRQQEIAAEDKIGRKNLGVYAETYSKALKARQKFVVWIVFGIWVAIVVTVGAAE